MSSQLSHLGQSITSTKGVYLFGCGLLTCFVSPDQGQHCCLSASIKDLYD